MEGIESTGAWCRAEGTVMLGGRQKAVEGDVYSTVRLVFLSSGFGTDTAAAVNWKSDTYHSLSIIGKKTLPHARSTGGTPRVLAATTAAQRNYIIILKQV
jgi:hypothetical protein